MTQAPAKNPWWHGAAIYQIYPHSFADSNGDGIGDLPGITAHLDYVASLGVEAIWLSPFFTSPMRDFGYDISDYCDVDPVFGTLQDFEHLVSRAHALGLRVIIDQVFSHTSDRHPWFQQSRMSRDNTKSDWYVWADPKPDGAPPSNWQSVFGGPAWAWDARRGQYFLHNFLTEQPDLNVHNQSVQDELLACARFWLDRGVDGFRLDAINFLMHDPAFRDNPPAPEDGTVRTRPYDYQLRVFNKSHADIPRFIERIREVTDRYPDRFTVAEVGGADSEPEMKLFTSGDKRFHSAYGFNFLYADRLTAGLVRQALGAWPEGEEIGWPSWAFSNHDAPRVVSRWASAEDRAAMARMAMLLLSCLRGNIFIYQGEELGLPQANIRFEQLRDPEAIANWPLTLGRDGARTPLPWTAAASEALKPGVENWLPIPAEHRALAVDLQEAHRDSQLAYTRRVLALRNRHEALKRGSLRSLETPQPVLAFEREAAGEHLLCVFNLGTTSLMWRPETVSWNEQAWRVIERSAQADNQGNAQDNDERRGWHLPPLSGLVAQRSSR